MECKQAKILLAPHILGDLDEDPLRCKELQAHLFCCADCTEMYEGFQEVIGFVRNHKTEFAQAFEKAREMEKCRNNMIYLDGDTQLMLRVAEGDVDAFNIIYKRYFRIVVDYATSNNGHSNSSEDIANEVFKRVWWKRAEYKPTSKVKTYLFTFTGTVVQEYQRRAKYQRAALDNFFPIIAEEPATEIIVQNIELREAVEVAKSRLSVKQRQAIEFAFYSNISIEEAAKLADCSYMVFCSRIKDAKKRLSVLLKQFRDY